MGQPTDHAPLRRDTRRSTRRGDSTSRCAAQRSIRSIALLLTLSIVVVLIAGVAVNSRRQLSSVANAQPPAERQGTDKAPAVQAAPASPERTGQPPNEKLDFNRHVRPILAQYCFKCHGPDDKQRESGLRLDQRDGALAPADSGARAIVPGQPSKSELLVRIDSHDESKVMPPPSSKKKLTDAERATLRKWIEQGAEYQPHWAFVAPRQAPLPRLAKSDRVRGPLDAYVVGRLEQLGLAPSPETDRYTLARRAYLDLTGLPPTVEQMEEFRLDGSPDAYERLVDKLLASPRYGERWARRWLDLARYADTNGYEKDRPRSIWPYRDWVICSLNSDLPFDQFTIEQLAGDMLPGATQDQRIATGFHRNTMINEEGGIDPLEFRFHAMVDRLNTTGTTWLGLTLACAYCHTHKFDPIPHSEYYSMFAMLNNADEPEVDVQLPDLVRRRAELEARIAQLEAALADQFPPEGELRWSTPKLSGATAASGAKLELQEDGSLLATGPVSDVDTYTIELDDDSTDVVALRLETLTHPSLGKTGPGRTPHGNFVLTEISATVAERGAKPGDQPAATPLRFASARADIEQDMFPVVKAFDGDPKSGWAIHNPSQPLNQNRSATFMLQHPAGKPGGSRWKITLQQQHGSQHTIGRFRLQLGRAISDGRPLEVRKREHLDRKFNEWLVAETAKSTPWTVARPVAAKSNLPLLTIQSDDSIFSSGDQSKSDLYEVTLGEIPAGVTAIRLEALPDDRLPKHGPGRVYYEGPHGDFFLSNIELELTPTGEAAGPATVSSKLAIAGASQSFASGGNTAAAALDDNKQTGWSINGGQGRSHAAVFNFKSPTPAAGKLLVKLLFERYYAAGMGRFRISYTQKPGAVARDIAPEIESLLAISADKRTPEQLALLRKQFLAVAPELAGPRGQIQELRNQLPTFPTTLVMQERPPENPRPTFRHHRGEFLQPKEQIQPGVISILPGLPADAPRNRLSFARWIASPTNPLVGRVTMNRQWAALFGRGIVRTTEDFGYQGESPSNQELLDYLAVELVRRGWSMKAMHRLMVTSATYRQSSKVTSELSQRDPHNELLARGPRSRLEAELIRDSLLHVSGLLSSKIGGPSVFPPQPSNVTTEGAYGQLAWRVSDGADRYRRGLYTFAKRTAPYAMFTTFDGPSGEACVARREMSNTPLQALTLLNDQVFLEAAQAIGRKLRSDYEPGFTAKLLNEDGTESMPRMTHDRGQLVYLFRMCMTRPPTARELEMLVEFRAKQYRRFVNDKLDAKILAGSSDGDVIDKAIMTALARALLNLDEAISKH